MKAYLNFLIISILFIFSGCGKMISASFEDGATIGGKVFPLSGLLTSHQRSFISAAYASVCTEDVYARLFEIGSDGKLSDTPLQSVLVGSDARYVFTGRDLKLSETISYQVVIAGCDQVLSRPVTNLNLNQDVTFLSTVVGETARAEGLGRLINEVDRNKIEELISGPDFASLNEAFTKLSTDLTLKTHFVNVFQSQPDVLIQTLPTMTTIQVPALASEGIVNQLKLGAYHWNNNYDFAYEWYVDGVLKHVGSTWNYSPTGNEQGDYSVRYIVGRNDGSGRVDTSKPYIDGIRPLTIMDTIPAVAPDMSIAGNLTITTSRNIQVELITGTGQVFCESFTSLALTEEYVDVPTNMSWFNITCDTPFVQTVNVTLESPGDGLKNLRLWARDASGKISVASKNASILLDTTPPALAFSTLPVVVKGGNTININFSVVDSSENVKTLYYAEDGLSFTLLATAVTSPYNWNVPHSNTSGAKLKLVATDEAGHSSELVSPGINIDSTAPAVPVLTLTSSNPTNLTTASFSIASCVGVHEVSIGEGASASLWESCATNKTYTFNGSTQGTRTIKLWARDEVHNVSSPASLSLVYDSLPPETPAVVLAMATSTNLPTASFSVTDCSDRAMILVNGGAFPVSTDADWIPCSTVVGATTKTFTALNDTEVFHFWAKDVAGNISTLSSTLSVRHDNTAPLPLEFILAPKGDDPSLGYDNIGTSFTNVSVKVSDTHPGTKVRFKLANAATGECSLLEAEKNDAQWKSYLSGGTPVREYFNITLSPGDGTKKVCLWAKDSTGNITSDDGLKDFSWDDVEFSVGNIPQITSFTVTNIEAGSPRLGTTNFTAGEMVSVSWTIEDKEGLDENPVTLDYVTVSSTENLLTDFGNLSGNIKNFSYTHTFPAPTTSYFRLRIRAKDSAGNSSVAVMSDSCNTGNWSVYAGTTDRGVGGGAKAALLRGYTNAGFNRFAINPKNNDIWAIDSGQGMLKLDAVTGVVSKVISHGTTNLGTSGKISGSVMINVSDVLNFMFGHDGMIYFVEGNSGGSYLSRIYKLDPVTLDYELYAGGGGLATSTDPMSLATMAGSFALDEDLSLYTQVHCSPGTAIPATDPHLLKLYKITQNPVTKKADMAIHVAGDCVSETANTTGVDARLTRFHKPTYPHHTALAVWDRGEKIFYGDSSSKMYKIIGGKLYASDIPRNTGVTYNKFDGKVYLAHTSSGLQKVDLNLSGNNGDVSTVVIPEVQTVGCTSDDILAENACVSVGGAPYISESGTVFFPDGATMNNGRATRIRYIGDDLKVRTALGSQPNNGDGINKRLVRAPIGGIYYKKASEPAQEEFPEGLYFVDSEGITFNHIHPVTGVVTTLLGNQSNIPVNVFPANTKMDKGVGLGAAYGAGSSGKAIMFDENGFPILVNDTRLFRIDANYDVISMTTGSKLWDAVPDNDPATSTYLRVFGGTQNLTGTSSKVFLIGGYRTANTNVNVKASIRVLDFANDKIKTIMGGSAEGVSVETTTPGSVQALTLSEKCINDYNPCMIHYDRTSDNLYFSEENKIRYIEKVSTPANQRLRDLVTGIGTGTIFSFIFSPSKDQIFYIKGGKLYCHNLTASSIWCNDTSLGPSTGLSSISTVANQMTWLNNRALLVSTKNGEIYQYNLFDP